MNVYHHVQHATEINKMQMNRAKNSNPTQVGFHIQHFECSNLSAYSHEHDIKSDYSNNVSRVTGQQLISILIIL